VVYLPHIHISWKCYLFPRRLCAWLIADGDQWSWFNLFLQCTQVLSLTEQVGNFTNLARMVGSADLISRSLIFISTGNNDLFECADFSNHSCHDNYTEFLQSLVASYTKFVKVHISPNCSFTSNQIHSGLA
jgi:hypothetical protein